MRARHFAGIALTACLLFSCDSDVDAGSGLEVTTANEPAGENCAAGGKRLDITHDGVTSPFYVCDGVDGADQISVGDAGEQCAHGGSVIQVGEAEPVVVRRGKDGASEKVVMDAVEPGDDCTYGGISLMVGEGSPIYVCTGADGDSVTVATEPKGENCEQGGLALTVGAGAPMYVCNGEPSESVTLTPEPPGDHCPRGGVKMQVGAGAATYVLTWTPRESSRSWGLVASSADGSKLVAAPVSGPLYVTGTGSLVARPASLVELTYTGNAQFFVSNVQGTVEAP